MNGLKQTKYHSIQKKSVFSLCHKSTDKYNLSLVQPVPRIVGIELTRKASIKFIGVILDENLIWKDHISTIESKISKNIGLIFRAKNVLSIYYLN